MKLDMHDGSPKAFVHEYGGMLVFGEPARNMNDASGAYEDYTNSGPEEVAVDGLQKLLDERLAQRHLPDTDD